MNIDENCFYIVQLEEKLKKYENALFIIANFGGGREEKGNITVDGSYDEPGSVEIARKALGRKFCQKYKDKRRK